MFSDHETSPLAGTPEHAASELAAVLYIAVSLAIGYAVTTLAHFLDRPAKVHNDALRRVARYLRMTKACGLHFWRQQLLPSLLVGMFQPLPSDPSLPSSPEPLQPTLLAGYVDAAHATDLKTLRSITGLVFMFCGGPITFKSKIQPTV
jgi:hypothetical protein